MYNLERANISFSDSEKKTKVESNSFNQKTTSFFPGVIDKENLEFISLDLVHLQKIKSLDLPRLPLINGVTAEDRTSTMKCWTFLVAVIFSIFAVVLGSPISQGLEDVCQPKQVHLSFGNVTTEVIVMWATSALCSHEVQYAIHPWGFQKVATGQQAIFNHRLNANGLQHHYRVKLQDLLPSTTYFYRPVSGLMSAGPFYFKTPQAGEDWSADFLIFGDLGIHTQSLPFLTQEALSGNYTAVFHIGDIAYDLKSSNGEVGDYFMEMIEPIASTIPYMICPGNHEIDEDSFIHYRYRFSMPGSSWPSSKSKMWYSIDIGPVHFVSYSSEVFFTNRGKFVRHQQEWLVQDLVKANSNRERVPWIIAYGHRPLYCSTHIGDDCSKQYSLVRQGLEDLFHNLSVDVIIQAHEHNYERLWPLYKGKVVSHSYVNPSVPVQIITGAAGSYEGADHFPHSKKTPWSAFRMDEKALNSYGRFLVVNRSHIFWEQRSIVNHSAFDSIWIIKNHPESLHQNISFSIRKQVIHSRFLQIAILSFVSSGIAVVIIVIVVRVVVKWRRQQQFRPHQLGSELDDFDNESDMSDN